MNFLRGLVGWLIFLLFLLACVAGLLFVPTVQTELAQFWLGRGQGAVRITVGFVNAGINSAHLEGVHVTAPGFDLTAPVVDIGLPVSDFVLHHRADVRHLEAKGWKVSGLEEALALSGSALPWKVTVQGADLEGEIMVSPGRGKRPVPVDVVIKGGGVGPGQNGHFDLQASGVFLTDDLRQIYASANGDLSLGLGPGHPPVKLKATLQAHGGGFDPLSGLIVSAEFGGADESVSLAKGSRVLVAVSGTVQRGAWSLDLVSDDIAPFYGDTPPPPFAATGNGAYVWDPDKTVVSATGTLRGVANHWPFSATTQVRHHGHELKVSRLDGIVANIGVHALQSFTFDETTHAVTFERPTGDLARLSLDRAPLNRIPALPLLGTTYVASAGTASGDVLISGGANQSYTVRSEGALAIGGLAIRRGAAPWADDIDGRLNVTGALGGDPWQLTATHMTLTRSGQPLLSGDVTATRDAAPDQPWLVHAKFGTDTTLGELGPAQVKADVNGLVGAGAKLDGTVEMRAKPNRVISSNFNFTVDEDGGAQITLPLTIAFGDEKSDLVLDGTRVHDENGDRWYLKISGGNVICEQLQLLAAPFLNRLAASRPFWGSGGGRLGITVDHVQYHGTTWSPLDALVSLSPTQVQFMDVRVGLDARRTVSLTGGITYDAAAAEPYDFTASMQFNQVESGPIFPAKHGLPIVEGRFAVKRTLVSRGRDLPELLAHPLQTIEASSDTSIVRALAVNVGDAVPQRRTTVGKEAENTAKGVANFIFAMHNNPLEAGKNPVSPKAEAILEFTDEADEIGFDHLKVTAVEQPDGSYVISRIDGVCDDLKLTGHGRIGNKPAEPLSLRPLSLDLHLSVSGLMAALLAKGGVITAPKKKTDYVALPSPVHLGGTVGAIDVSQWHDFLAAALKGP